MPREQELIGVIRKLRELLQDIHAECGNYHGVASTSRHVLHEVIDTARKKSAEGLALVDDDQGNSKF